MSAQPDKTTTVDSFYDLFEALTYFNRGERRSYQVDAALLRQVQEFFEDKALGIKGYTDYLVRCAIPSSDFYQDPEIALWCVLLLNDLREGLQQFGELVEDLLEVEAGNLSEDQAFLKRMAK